MSKRYFIAGIHTGVGKTFFTCQLTRRLIAKGVDVAAYKPVISGYDDSPQTDTALIAEALGTTDHESISPWRFKEPLSPHMAAKLEGRELSLGDIVSWCQKQSGALQLFEGVGGLMVPLNDEVLVIDWIQSMNIPVILVASSYLGAINHTLMSLEILKQRQIDVVTTIVSQAEECVGLGETCDAIRTFSPAGSDVIALERMAKLDSTWNDAKSLLSLLV
ncbi:MAG: dethiobiotin synthase [Rickettsiales bacterium]|nr:dethiobiotin synthase [Rickettsiales bacterium]